MISRKNSRNILDFQSLLSLKTSRRKDSIRDLNIMEDTIFGDNSSQSTMDEKTYVETKRRSTSLCILFLNHYDSQKKEVKVKHKGLPSHYESIQQDS